jgi:hypothetical protein
VVVEKTIIMTVTNCFVPSVLCSWATWADVVMVSLSWCKHQKKIKTADIISHAKYVKLKKDKSYIKCRVLYRRQ